MAILIFIRSTSNFEHLLCVGLALGAGDTPTDKNTCSHGAESSEEGTQIEVNITAGGDNVYAEN